MRPQLIRTLFADSSPRDGGRLQKRIKATAREDGSFIGDERPKPARIASTRLGNDRDFSKKLDHAAMVSVCFMYDNSIRLGRMPYNGEQIAIQGRLHCPSRPSLPCRNGRTCLGAFRGF
jgi:hypothetical protein